LFVLAESGEQLPAQGSGGDTVAEVPAEAGEPGAASGRQRRQGRKPASAAAAAEG